MITHCRYTKKIKRENRFETVSTKGWIGLRHGDIDLSVISIL